MRDAESILTNLIAVALGARGTLVRYALSILTDLVLWTTVGSGVGSAACHARPGQADVAIVAVLADIAIAVSRHAFACLTPLSRVAAAARSACLDRGACADTILAAALAEDANSYIDDILAQAVCISVAGWCFRAANATLAGLARATVCILVATLMTRTPGSAS